MHWRGSLAAALVGFSLTAQGCDYDKPFVAPNADLSDPTLSHASEAVGHRDDPTVVVARLQAPGTEPSGVQSVGYTAAHVAAVVNGEAILDEELRAAAHDMLIRLNTVPEPDRSKRQSEVLQQTLDALVDREVVVQEAIERLKMGGGKNWEKIKEIAEQEFERNWSRPVREQYRIKSDDEFRAFLKQQGVTLEMQKRLVERQWIMQQYLQQRVSSTLDKIGHVQIVDYYDTHPEMFKVEDEVEWQDLFIAAVRYTTRDAAKRTAEQVAQRIRQGEDFVKLSDQFDDGDSKLRKGAGLGRKRGEIKPLEAEGPLFQLKEGEVAVVEKDNGFHVIRATKRQYAGLQPFDEKSQKLIKDKLRYEILQRETKRIITELKRKAVIEVYK